MVRPGYLVNREQQEAGAPPSSLSLPVGKMFGSMALDWAAFSQVFSKGQVTGVAGKSWRGWKGVPALKGLIPTKLAESKPFWGAMKGIRQVGKVGSGAAKFFGALGTGMSVAATLYGGYKLLSLTTKGWSKMGDIAQTLPQTIEQRTAFLRNTLSNRAQFGGDLTAANYGSTERSRALQHIKSAHGAYMDQRFIGREARYYSQF